MSTATDPAADPAADAAAGTADPQPGAAAARPAVTGVGTVAVIAHRRKSLGGGLPELRRRLAEHGITQPLWYEVPKSKKAPKRVRAAVAEGADLLLVWGGDGMVQRCLDTLADLEATDIAVGIIPAGTANLLAGDLGVPEDLADAVRIALSGRRHRIDLGRLNGEHFAVMAGVGFDADLIAAADGAAKRRFGRLAYLWSGVRSTRVAPTRMTIRVDGADWFEGAATCVLFGNVGTITGGIRAFDDARPDDGWLAVGVTTASGPLQWGRTLGRMAVGRSDRSPFVRTTQGRRITVRLAATVPYEMDGGVRGATDRLKVRVVPGAVTVCLPPVAAPPNGQPPRAR